MSHFKIRSIAGLATVAATMITVAFSTPLYAQEMHAEVRYGDLDLGTDAGRAALDKRIRHAAAAVCGDVDQLNKFHVAACRRKALASARQEATLAAAKAQSRVELARR